MEAALGRKKHDNYHRKATGEVEARICCHTTWLPHSAYPSSGEEKVKIERNPDLKARRWGGEVCHSWLNRFRKLLVQFEKKAEN